ncbi:MAG: pyridoxal-phosphate dependent enzyme [Chlamydiia bacterium]|nr:pyridoxal-phosphate dependent enzyme [Chlamydiia bacterium]
MSELFVKTPLVFGREISRRLDKKIFLKLECLQPSGSFKNRGMGSTCAFYQKQGFKGVVSSSGGNAGLATTFAAKRLGLDVKVVLSTKTPQFMVDKLESEGAEVIRYGDVWDKANVRAKEFAEELGYGFVSPFDHPETWKGHASLSHELKEQGEKPDAIILSVGGGGLMCGVAQGLHEIGWGDVPIIASETEGAASFAASVKAGKVVTLENVDTVAVSLGAKRVCDRAFEWTKEHEIHSVTVSDRQALDACLAFADDQRLLVEPACGAALAVLYEDLPAVRPYKKVIVVVCGGNLVNRTLLKAWE